MCPFSTITKHNCTASKHTTPILWQRIWSCWWGKQRLNMGKRENTRSGLRTWTMLVWSLPHTDTMVENALKASVSLDWPCHVGTGTSQTRAMLWIASGVVLLAVVCVCYWTGHSSGTYEQLTFLAERSFIWWVGTVTGVATVFFHTLAPIVAVASIAAAMTWAARSDSRGDLCPLFQVYFLPIQV